MYSNTIETACAKFCKHMYNKISNVYRQYFCKISTTSTVYTCTLYRTSFLRALRTKNCQKVSVVSDPFAHKFELTTVPKQAIKTDKQNNLQLNGNISCLTQISAG